MKRYIPYLLCFSVALAQNKIPFASVATSANNLSALEVCAAASASGTAYTCSTATTFVPAAGSQILFKPDVASGASPTLNVNSSMAAPLHKQGVALVANDLIVSQGFYVLTFDGVNWNMTGPGNAQFISYGSTATDSATLGPELTTAATTTSTGWTGTFPTFTNGVGNSSPLVYAPPSLAAGSYYQVAITASGVTAGSISSITMGAVAYAGAAINANGTYFFGPKLTSVAALTITPASTFAGSLLVSISQISPISTYALQTKDSTGANSYLLVNSLGSRNNVFEGGGGTYNTIGTGNSAQGANALLNNTIGNNNSAQGSNALLSNTTGSYNSAQGATTLFSNTTGSFNSAQGALALQNNTTGMNNSAQGSYSLQYNTTGSYNSAQGTGALENNTTGFRNSAQGVNALFSNTTGIDNTAQGANALYGNTTGGYNSAQGYEALQNNTTGTFNSAQGALSLQYNTTGTNNSAQGSYSLQYNTTGNGNTGQGSGALQNNTTGGFNAAQGYEALQNNLTGEYNAAQGALALQNNTTGNYNAAQGGFTLQYNTTGAFNAAQGALTLQSNTTGNNNSAQGGFALQYNTTGSNDTAQGSGALQKNTTGSNNAAQGVNSLNSNTTGSLNFCGGYQCGYRDGTSTANGNWHSITDNQMVFVGALASRDNSIPNTTSLTNGACIGYDCKVAANNTIELGNRIAVNTITTGTLSAPAVNSPSIVAGRLVTPGAPALTPAGAAGSTSYSYVIVARGYGGGPYSAASATATITSANAVLSLANYNTLTWFGSQNARCYDVYRTASAGTPSTTGLIASCQVSPYNDTGAVGDGTIAPTSGNVLGIQTKVTTSPYVPACNASSEGTHLAVSDSATQMWGATYSGGGSLHAGIYCDSSNWTVEASNLSIALATPSVSISGTGCTLGTPTGTNIAGLIPVTGSGSACTITLTWSNSFAYPNHSLCGPLQDRTSGTMATQASDTGTMAVFKAIALTAGDTLQYGTCTGY